MITTHILGYPRIGAGRELTFALEAYWRGDADAAHLERVGAELRASNHAKQAGAGLALVTAGDFAFYDHVLDHAVLFGALPARQRRKRTAGRCPSPDPKRRSWSKTIRRYGRS